MGSTQSAFFPLHFYEQNVSRFESRTSTVTPSPIVQFLRKVRVKVKVSGLRLGLSMSASALLIEYSGNLTVNTSFHYCWHRGYNPACSVIFLIFLTSFNMTETKYWLGYMTIPDIIPDIMPDIPILLVLYQREFSKNS